MSCDVLDIYPREEDMSSFQNMDRKRMHLEEEEKENSDIKQSLQVLANGITELQASLMKPKERKPNLKDIDQKVDDNLFNQSWSDSLNTMKEENPWDISSIFDLVYFCCPECECKSQSKQEFIMHAANNHPWVSLYTKISQEEFFCLLITLYVYNQNLHSMTHYHYNHQPIETRL